MLLIYMICLALFLWTVINNKKEVYLIAIVIWTATAYFINEILSINNLLDKKHLLIVYAVLCIFVAGALVYQIIKKRFVFKLDLSPILQKSVKEKTVLVLLGVFFLIMFAASLIMIPHTVDSMTYNMTRIAYWTQNNSVAHYATNDVRAVTTSPLAEFINLQVYILHNKSDALFNLLQSLSYITNTFLVMGICKKIDLSKRYRYLCALLYISMPIAFAEALTTQIEQFATMWLLIFVYFILDIIDEDFRFSLSAGTIGRVLVLGACIAFGYLTKLSVMFGMLVFALWLLLACIKRKERLSTLLVLIAIAAVEMLVLVMPEIARNLETFHAISSSDVGAKHMIDTLNPIYLIINALKNASINLPNIYFPWIAKGVSYCIFWIAYKCNVDINDPRIAHDGVEYIVREPQRYMCDSAVNPVVFYLTVFTLVVLLLNLLSKQRGDKKTAFAWAGIISFAFFCFALKYELYGVRYMLSYLALLCPTVCVGISKIEYKKKSWIVPLVIFMCIVELSGLFLYHGERVVRHFKAEDRITGYLDLRQKDEAMYRALGDYLSTKEYESLGIYFAWGAGEYPIWKMVDEDVRIGAVNVKNETSIYQDENFVPDYIVVKDADPKDIEVYKGKNYELDWVAEDRMYLYKRN